MPLKSVNQFNQWFFRINSSKRREAEHAEKSAEFFVGGDGGIFNLKPLKFPLRSPLCSLRLGVSILPNPASRLHYFPDK
jgi:hypothetical protein